MWRSHMVVRDDGEDSTILEARSLLGVLGTRDGQCERQRVTLFGDNIADRRLCSFRLAQTARGRLDLGNQAMGGAAIRRYAGSLRTVGVQFSEAS